MRHGLAQRKFGRSKSQRQALLINLAVSLLDKEQIFVTLPKARDLRSIVEKLITKAGSNTLHTRRYLMSQLRNNAAIVDKLLAEIGPRYKERPGGYTRVLKAGFRQGDNAPMAIIELVDRPIAEAEVASDDQASDNA